MLEQVEFVDTLRAKVNFIQVVFSWAIYHIAEPSLHGLQIFDWMTGDGSHKKETSRALFRHLNMFVTLPFSETNHFHESSYCRFLENFDLSVKNLKHKRHLMRQPVLICCIS